MAEKWPEKSEQTIYERAEIGERAITELRKLVKDLPIDVLGHLNALAWCCSGGTVAIVKVDLEQVVRK